MLIPEILEYDTHKIILYRNVDEVAIREVVLDLNNNIIQDEISEYDKHGNLICSNVFINHTILIAYRNYGKKDDDYGYKDYKLINGQFKLILQTKNEWLIPEKKAKCSWYDGDGQLAYYDIFDYYEDIEQMCISEKIYPENSKYHGKILEGYSDYYLKFI